LLPEDHYRLYFNPNAIDSALAHSTLGQDNFVAHFFQTSRLHFLSTWRNEFQAQLTEYIQNLCHDDEKDSFIDATPNENLLLTPETEGPEAVPRELARVVMHVDMVIHFFQR
jgi:hypothetical protein